MISCMVPYPRGFKGRLLLIRKLDSGLESIHRKELKGWARSDGIVKEDSEWTVPIMLLKQAF